MVFSSRILALSTSRFEEERLILLAMIGEPVAVHQPAAIERLGEIPGRAPEPAAPPSRNPDSGARRRRQADRAVRRPHCRAEARRVRPRAPDAGPFRRFIG